MLALGSVALDERDHRARAAPCGFSPTLVSARRCRRPSPTSCRPIERTRAYGLLYWAINLGFAGASVFGGVLAERHFLLLFVIDALTTFAYGAVVFVGVPETRHRCAAEWSRARRRGAPPRFRSRRSATRPSWPSSC